MASHVFEGAHAFAHFTHFVDEVGALSTAAVVAGPTAAAFVVQRAARKKFGHYQGESGPFEAWPQLASSTKSERVRLGYTENDPLLRSGELRDSYKVESSGLMAGVGSTLGKAEGMEVGDPIKSVPARPVLGPAFAENEKEAFEASAVPLMALLTTGKLPMRRSVASMATNGDRFGIVDVTD
jgi:hypothetical protein